jgi:exonuclease SbcD
LRSFYNATYILATDGEFILPKAEYIDDDFFVIFYKLASPEWIIEVVIERLCYYAISFILKGGINGSRVLTGYWLDVRRETVVRFMHIADVHLGNQQYNLPARFDDFGRAFLRAVDLAIAEQVDAVVIAGDLFHKASVEPTTLIQAENGLVALQTAGITVVAVTGNHDKARYMAQASWLDYLAERGLVCLLTPYFDEEPLILAPWDTEARTGGYLDVGNVRFIGVPWLGASAPRILAEAADQWHTLDWAGINFTVLVTHAGVEGQMPNMPGGLKHDQLAPIKGKVDYLALGHLHKPYEVDNWIYNPGSLETCSFDEIKDKRGVYLVDVDAEGRHTAVHHVIPMRPFFTIEVLTDMYLTPDLLLDAVVSHIRQAKRRIEREVAAFEDQKHSAPVVRLVLKGNLHFDRAQLNLESLREALRDEIQVLHSRVYNQTTPPSIDVKLEDQMDRGALEQQVFESIVKNDARFGGDIAGWSQLMREIKLRVTDSAEPAEVYAMLDAHMQSLEMTSHVDH